MDDIKIEISTNLQTAYNEQYSDKITEWRELGGKYKALNILAVCKGNKFERVLECGAGEGSILKFLNDSKEFSKLFAIEISDSGISQIRKRTLNNLIEVKKFDGYVIPYPDKYFDMAYCSHVIEHVEYPRILLRELKRVSSFQVFEVPLDYSRNVDSSVDSFLAYGHINIFTPSLFKFLLKSEGYKILREHFSTASPDVVRYNWYKNRKIRPTLMTEMKLILLPWIKMFKVFISNKERGFGAYTCLASGCSDLKIF
jgi:ubiquinone/menaquinone biosynthesis C-methylase UbiE